MPGSSIFMWWWDQDLNPEEEGIGSREGEEREVGRHRENYSVKELCIDSYLTTCMKGGDLIHTL